MNTLRIIEKEGQAHLTISLPLKLIRFISNEITWKSEIEC